MELPHYSCINADDSLEVAESWTLGMRSVWRTRIAGKRRAG
jgi:hypothetical protein